MSLLFTSPPLSLSDAHKLALFFAGSYVGSLYVSQKARLSFKQDGEQRAHWQDERWRDHPDVIRARLTAAGLSTLSSCGVVAGLALNLIGRAPENIPFAIETALTRIGFIPRSPLSELVSPCLVTPVLFLGPLYGEFLAGNLPFEHNWSWQWSVRPLYATWQGIRNFIVGPLTEEIVFRGCTLAVYHLAGTSKTKMIFLTPLLFGIAHAHHAWEIFNRYGRTKAAAKRASIVTAVQLSYTSLFGFHTAFLFLRTGSLIPPVTAHIFCNIMGLPQIGLHMAKFPRRRLAIQAAYLLGIAGYIYMMKNWTLVSKCIYWAAEGTRQMF